MIPSVTDAARLGESETGRGAAAGAPVISTSGGLQSWKNLSLRTLRPSASPCQLWYFLEREKTGSEHRPRLIQYLPPKVLKALGLLPRARKRRGVWPRSPHRLKKSVFLAAQPPNGTVLAAMLCNTTLHKRFSLTVPGQRCVSS